MSTLSMDAVDASAFNSSDVNLKDFSLEILNTKPFYAFEVPKFMIDTTMKVFSIGDKVLADLCKGFEKISNAENLVMFFQDVVAVPAQVGAMKNKLISYTSGKQSLLPVANQARKLAAFISSTVGDFYFSCEALKEMKIPVGKIHVFTERAGLWGSALGAASRVFDYVAKDFEDQNTIKTYPVSSKVRSQIIDSKRAWDCARDVSILAVSLLGVFCGGFANIPSAALVGFSGSILGSRLVSVYKDTQLKKVDDCNPCKSQGIKELKK
jgi:hypothetical protein